VIDIPTIDELREARRRLAEEAGLNVERYAGILQEREARREGAYVSMPLLPQPMFLPREATSPEPERLQAGAIAPTD
jgi:hypothetical protein